MTAFRYETHLHTSETSKCAKSPGAEFAEFYKARGYTGVFVTDHFLNGNTTVPPELSWEQRINDFCRGYEATAARGARIGLDVFFAWEYSDNRGHFLTYGLGKEWLLDHPDLLAWDGLHYFDRVRADGGMIVHAHPFREKVEVIHLIPGKTDAVEIVNAGRPDDANRHAADYARSFGLPETAGSDIHAVGRPRLCGIEVSQPLNSGKDYLAALGADDVMIFDESATDGKPVLTA